MMVGMSLFGFIPFVFACVCAEIANAQSSGGSSNASMTTISLDGGAIYVKQPSHAAIGAAAISLRARRATTHTALVASGLLIGSADSSTAVQGTFGAELAWPKQPSLRLEFSGTATSFGVLSADQGGSRDGYVRPQFVRATYGVFGTFGAGTVNRNHVGQHALAWDAGAWRRYRNVTGVLSLRHSFTNDFLLMEASNIFLSRDAHHYSLQDIQGMISVRVSRFELLTSATWRDGVGATTGHGNAWFGSLTTDLTNRFALVVNGGKQLAEPLSGIPAARVLGASLRLNLLGGGSVRAIPQMSSATAPSKMSPFATRVNRHATGGATVTVRVDAPIGARVEFAGSFNDWASVAMPRVNDAFELTVELPRGSHRLAVRVNGGEWKAPEGLARVKDDLGGESGIVVVP